MIIGLFLLGAGALLATETAETYKGALGAFLAGRLADAESAYKYLVQVGVDGSKPTANLALLARDQGRADEAAALWTKATLLDEYDALMWNQRGWSQLSIASLKEAREAFRKAVQVSSGPALAAEAGFGLGLVEQMDGNPKAAIAAYQSAYTRSPYLLPAVAAQLARLAVGLHKWTAAETYFKQSLEQDQLQPDIALELARVLEKEGTVRGAWQAYKLALDMDPALEEARRGMDRMAREQVEKMERYLPVRRLVRPMLQKADVTPPSPPLRIGLFADPTGEPANATHLYFVSGSDFRIVDLRLGEVTRGAALDQWEVLFREDTRIIELRDTQHNVKFTTKQSFRIEPLNPGFTVLVKSVTLEDIKGVDIGDRELRGVVEIQPAPHGWAVINEVALEDYVSGIVTGAMPTDSPREALRTHAVLARTRAASVPHGKHHPFYNTDLCDSSHCQVYAGLAGESAAGREAVLSTAGGKLFKNGALFPAPFHPACGWATEERGEDAPAPSGLFGSVLDLERLLHGYPPPSLYCELSSFVPPSWMRWARVVKGDVLRARIERTRFIGRLHDVRVVSRTPTGRVQALDVVGSRDTMRVEGPRAIEQFLAPRGLRSTLFTLQPLYRGKVLDQLVVWGAGTGDGHGLCLAGAMGQAHLRRRYGEILAFYYPGVEVRGAPAEPVEEPVVYKAETGGMTPEERERARRKHAARIRQAQKERAKRRGVDFGYNPARAGVAVGVHAPAAESAAPPVKPKPRPILRRGADALKVSTAPAAAEPSEPGEP